MKNPVRVAAALAWDQGERLTGVHPHLIAVMIRAAYLYHSGRGCKIRFTSGFRTLFEQEKLVQTGKSKTLHSYHTKGRAVDVAIFTSTGFLTWDLDYYADFNSFVQTAARETGALITWGGHWGMKDGVHFQLETLT